MRTSGTVTTVPSKTGSCTSPRWRISARAWRMTSPTRNWRCDGAPDTLFCFMVPCTRVWAKALQRPRDFLDAVTFDDIAGAHVLVFFEGHTAFLARRHFAHFVLEPLQGLQGALVHDDVIADQAHAGTALDNAIRNPTAGDLADLGDVEDLQD